MGGGSIKLWCVVSSVTEEAGFSCCEPLHLSLIMQVHASTWVKQKVSADVASIGSTSNEILVHPVRHKKAVQLQR